ncbi:MAG: serine/threonine-protein kinase, partial [Isosphaeraceae bacterium]
MTTDDDPVEDLLDQWEAARDQGSPRSPEEIWAEHPGWHGDPGLLESFKSRVAGLLRAAALGLGGGPEPAPSLSLLNPPRPNASVSRFIDLAYLAHGGLGVVYSAIDVVFHRKVALKFLLPSRAGFAVVRERFLKEALLTARLDHPGIAPVYGQGDAPDGRPYYAMRLVEGETLQDRIDEHYQRFPRGSNTSERSLGFRRLLGQLVSVCNTVAYAHDEGVLHRDLKPSNVKIGRFDRVVVLDWGLARTPSPDVGADGGPGVVADDFPPLPNATTPGQGLGTWGFASPEQTEGRHADVGPRSDVYSLGAVLYCVLTGEPPFSADTREELRRKVLAGDFAPPRKRDATLDPALEAVCLKAMALKPEDRYASVQAMGEDLQRWLADEPVSVYREPRRRRIARWRRRNRAFSRVLAGVAAVGLIGLTLGGVARYETWRREMVERQAEALLRRSEASLAAGEWDSARSALGGASALIAEESGFDSLRSRIQSSVDRAESRARVTTFLPRAELAEFHLLGGYWTLLPHEETAERRRITHPGERAADLAAGVALARAALDGLGVGEEREPFAKLTSSGVERAEVDQVRRRAAELSFLLGIAEERLGQAEPPAAQADRRAIALDRLSQAEAL